MPKRPGYGSLLIVGGHEDKEDDKVILRAFVKRAGKSTKTVVATLASQEPKAIFEEYEMALRGLGMRHIHHLSIGTREEATSESKLRILDDAGAVYFSGGDQLKITSQIGDTPIYSRVCQIFESGGVVAGSSAGASIMSETMMVSGNGDSTYKIDSLLRLAPGLGLLRGVIIDQHFSQRGRIGRLLGAIAQNPRMLGIGLDEDCGILVQRGRFQVVGSNAVHVIDGSKVTFSNLTEAEPETSLCIYGIRLHVLNQSDTFDLKTRRPRYNPERVVRDWLKLPPKDESSS
ncbi:MAG TPA: cyanophycinase [Gemmatimonadaceae bacterium]|nr:cyanophycinase [Gemmatimonadaceae bacterium]